MSKTTKFSSHSHWLTKFSAACKEILKNTQELPKQALLTGKILFPKNGAKKSGSGSCHANNLSENQQLIIASTALPCKTRIEHITAPEDAMQIDLVPEFPTSGGYEKIVTAMDVFSRSLFAYPTSNEDAKTNAKVITNIMTKHAYLPTTLISDKGTAFKSHVTKEVAGVLGLTLKHATTNHARTVGLVERSHASMKQLLKIETGERRSLWHKRVNIVILNYNTSYHTSNACEPSRVFHGRVPSKILALLKRIRSQQAPFPNSQIAQDILDQTELIY